MPDLMEEFDDIVAALRSERPEIDPGFASELDTRAAAGFAKPRRRWHMPTLIAPAFGLGLATLLVVAIVSSGGTSGDSSSSSGSSGGTVASAPTEQLAPQAERDAAGASGASASAAVPAAAPAASKALTGRVQELNAALTLVGPGRDMADLGDKVIAVADQTGGFVQSSDVRAGTDAGGNVTLRIPDARLNDALGRLSRLAHVSSRTEGSQDITGERNSARNRLDEAVAERTSLLKRLAAATTDNETASLKARLRDVGVAIDADRNALAHVLRRAHYATVDVTLAAKQKAIVAPDHRWTPGDAVKDAGRVLEVAAGVVLVVGSVLLPLSLLLALALVGQRAAARRGRTRMLETV